MGTVATDTSKLIGMGAGNITCFASEFSMSGEYAIDDASGMCDTENQNVMGKQGVASVSANGRYEDGTGEIAVNANTALSTKTNEPIIMLPLGVGAGLPAMCEHGLTTQVEVESPADGLTTIAIEGASDVGLELGFQVGERDTAITATGNSPVLAGTPVMGGDATSPDGGAAYLAVTDFTGLTSIVVIVEDSTDGLTGWATVATFPIVTTDKKAQRVEIPGVIKEHVRFSHTVVGTGSAKLLRALSRNNV